MERVLSVPAPRGCHGPSSYVTKRLCISIVFVVGFICIIIGHVIGKIATQHEYFLKHPNFLHSSSLQNIGPEILDEINLLSLKADELFSMKSNFKEEYLNENDIVNIIKAVNCSTVETNVKMSEIENLKKYLQDRDEYILFIRSIVKRNVKKMTNCIENAISTLSLIHLR